MSDVSVTAMPPVGMITLRGELATLGKAVKAVSKCAVPAQRMHTKANGYVLLWMSPDELLLICDYAEAPGIAAKLQAKLAGVHATVAVVSDARAVFDVSGPRAETALAKLAPVDFARLAPTEVRRTRMGQVAAAMWRQDAGWRVVCFRSVAGYAGRLLENAAA